MFIRIPVIGLSVVLQPKGEAISKPLRWLSLLEEMLRPYKDVRLVVTSSQAHAVEDLRQLLGPLAPRLYGYTGGFLPEEDAIAASVREVSGQIEHLVLFSSDFDFSRQSLNALRCDPIAEALEVEGVRARLEGHDFTGTASTNICNQGKSKAGVQMELTEALREVPDALAGVVRAVRSVLMQAAGIGA